MTIPLLIGGATTSRAHTAVKVDPRYDGPVVWVKDASRSVPVASALLSDAQRPSLLADIKADFDALRTRHAARHDRRLVPISSRAGQPPAASTGPSRSPPPPARPGIHVLRRLRPGRAAGLHRLAAVLQRLGDEGPVPRHPQQPGDRGDRPPALRRRPGDARPDGRRAVDPRRGASSGSSRRTQWATTSSPTPTRRGARCGPRIHTCASRASTATACPTRRWPTSSHPGTAALPTTSAPSRSPPAWGCGRRCWSSRTALDDYSRHHARGAGRPAGRGVRRAAPPAGAHRALGLRRRRAGQRHEDLLARAVRRHPARAGLPGAVPTTPTSSTLWELLDVESATGIELTESMAMWPGAQRVAAGTSPTRSRSTSSSVGSGATRSRTTRGGGAGRMAEAERWLSAAPRLRPGRLSRAPTAGRRRSCGTWTAPSSTPSRTGCDTEFALAEELGGTLEPRARAEPRGQRPDQLRVATSASTWASTWSPPRSSSGSSTAWSTRVASAVPWRPGARRAAGGPARPRRPVRAGDDVVPPVRRPPSWPHCLPGTFAEVVTGDAVSHGKPHPEPYLKAAARPRRAPEPTAWPSRTPTPGPAAPSRPGAPLSSSSRTTCPCSRARGGCSPTPLVGLDHRLAATSRAPARS